MTWKTMTWRQQVDLNNQYTMHLTQHSAITLAVQTDNTVYSSNQTRPLSDPLSSLGARLNGLDRH